MIFCNERKMVMGQGPRFKTFYVEVEEDDIPIQPIVSQSFADSIKGKQFIETEDGTIVEEEIPLVSGGKIVGRYGDKSVRK